LIESYFFSFSIFFPLGPECLRGVGIGLWFAVHGDLLLTAVYLILEQVIFEFEVGDTPLTISTCVIYTDCPGRERTVACRALGQLTVPFV
jgi:hypothetical protein